MNAELQEDIRSHYDHYSALFPSEKEKLSQWTVQIDATAPLNSRKNMNGHATASGIILHPDSDKVLLIWHNALRRYQQPGGHIDDDDESVIAAARREVVEETGVNDVVLHPWHDKNGCPINIDTHLIAARPEKDEGEHLHHDHAFIFTTNTTDVVLQLEEVSDWKWVPITEVTKENNHVATSIKKAQELGLIYS